MQPIVLGAVFPPMSVGLETAGLMAASPAAAGGEEAADPGEGQVAVPVADQENDVSKVRSWPTPSLMAPAETVPTYSVFTGLPSLRLAPVTVTSNAVPAREPATV